MKRAVRVGVTGKLGSGKSSLMQALAESGIRVLNTDEIARERMVTDAEVRARIEALVGSEVYLDGELDRKLLASKVFNDEAVRKELEGVVHPAVTRHIERAFTSSAPGTIVAVESALILSTELKQIFDYIVLVDASEDVVLQRIRHFSHISEDDAIRRLRIQDFEHANYDEVDITIENSGTPEEFIGRARTLAQMLHSLALRELPAQPLHAFEHQA